MQDGHESAFQKVDMQDQAFHCLAVAQLPYVLDYHLQVNHGRHTVIPH